MADKPTRVSEMTPKQLQSSMQMAVFVGVFGANVVLGAIVTILMLLAKQ